MGTAQTRVITARGRFCFESSLKHYNTIEDNTVEEVGWLRELDVNLRPLVDTKERACGRLCFESSLKH